MEFTIAAYTDIGIQKTSNQDSLCLRRASGADGEILFAAVCDGMGGLQKGEVASAVCIRALCDWFDSGLSRFSAPYRDDFRLIRQEWTDLFHSLHARLLAYSAAHQVQLGTTVTVFLAWGDRFLTANIGDSRIYERKSSLRQLTHDQSLVAREIAAGRITEDEARHHPQRNVLLQCLGAGETAIPDFTEGRVQGDAVYLLCSDGMCHEIPPTELSQSLDPHCIHDKAALIDTLATVTELCKSRGETDNITGIMIRATESLAAAPKPTGLKGLFHALSRKKQDEPAPQAVVLESAQLTHTQEGIDM